MPHTLTPADFMDDLKCDLHLAARCEEGFDGKMDVYICMSCKIGFITVPRGTKPGCAIRPKETTR